MTARRKPPMLFAWYFTLAIASITALGGFLAGAASNMRMEQTSIVYRFEQPIERPTEWRIEVLRGEMK